MKQIKKNVLKPRNIFVPMMFQTTKHAVHKDKRKEELSKRVRREMKEY